MSVSGNLNPNVVKTALDAIFEQHYNAKMHPGFADATSPLIFMQKSTDRAAEIQEIFKGVGLWEERGEEQDVPQGTPRFGNKQTLNVANYSKSVDITKNFFDDNQEDAYETIIRDIALMGRLKRDDNAMSVWRNAFTTTLTADGASLVSDSHTTLGGDTVDNKLTAELSEVSLNDAIVKLMNQKNQAGVITGSVAKTLLVPSELFKLACEIVESDLRSGTADNDFNVYSSKYGINVVTSNRLGAGIQGGSNTAWFLLSDYFGVDRYVRQGMTTDLVDYKYSRNNNYIYKGEFREVVGAWDYFGTVGSDGTTTL